jgi:hypothetical protein
MKTLFKRGIHICLLLAFVLLAPWELMFAQMTITGTIGGIIIDPSGTIVPGAKITLINESTKDIREAATNESGAFSFVALQPETYTVRVEHSGFKTFERSHVVMSANEHIALGTMALEVGTVSETVTVEALAAHVETDSSEESADITTDQIGNLTARGRDIVSMLRTIPGVSYQADQDSAGGSYGTTSPAIRFAVPD